MKFLDKIEPVKFVLIVLVLTFLFCLIMSSQFKSINNRVMGLLEYQTKMIGQGYDSKEITSVESTYQSTPSSTTNKYKNYEY